jgi:hypothetical protein
LEDRLQPGDTVLGCVLGGALLGPDLSILAHDLALDGAYDQPPHNHRPAHPDTWSGRNYDPVLAVGVFASLPEDLHAATDVHVPFPLTQGTAGNSTATLTQANDSLVLQLASNLSRTGSHSRPADSDTSGRAPGLALLAKNQVADVPLDLARGSEAAEAARPAGPTIHPARAVHDAQPAKPTKAATPSPAEQAHVQESYGQLPVSFEANQGQTDAPVRFLAHGSGYSLALTPQEAVLSLQKAAPSHAGAASPSQASPPTVIHMQFLGANVDPQLRGQDDLPTKVNYYQGNDPRQWHTNIATYAKVEYQNLYPGINLVYYGNQQQLEYDFVVAPGADPRAIQLGFAGTDQVSLDTQGDLVLHSAAGEIHQHKPFLYQEVEGVRQEIAGSFVFHGPQQVGFQVAAYDTSRPLVIDPAIVYSSYFGGPGVDFGRGIAVDGFGSAYMTGYTTSPFVPLTSPWPWGYGLLGNADVFVTKIAPTGAQVLWTTFLGGSNNDYGEGIAYDGNSYEGPSGIVHVTGETYSPNYPTTGGTFRPVFGTGPCDGFVTSLNAATGILLQSTFIGNPMIIGNPTIGNGGHGIVVDGSSNIYATGYTEVAPSQIQVLVTPLDPFLRPLFTPYCGLYPQFSFGGNNYDVGWGIAVDIFGNQYITGGTSSTTFPTTPGAFQTKLSGPVNAFVTQFNPCGVMLYSTFLGGTGGDVGSGIAVDWSSGNAYVTGTTSSNNFPTTLGAFQRALRGASNAFVSEVNPNLFGAASLVYSTYLGGNGNDAGFGIAVDTMTNAYVTGQTTATNFPTTLGVFQPAKAGQSNAFVSKVNPTGTGLVYSTYLGGNGNDVGSGIAVDAAGNAYVTGTTSSNNFPTTLGVFQPWPGGGATDAFVTKIL